MLSHGVYIYAVLADTPKEFLSGGSHWPSLQQCELQFLHVLANTWYCQCSTLQPFLRVVSGIVFYFFIYTFLITGWARVGGVLKTIDAHISAKSHRTEISGDGWPKNLSFEALFRDSSPGCPVKQEELCESLNQATVAWQVKHLDSASD